MENLEMFGIDDIDKRLKGLESHADVIALATDLVNDMNLTSDINLYYATKNLAVACIDFLYDWGNPGDFNVGGLNQLVSMAQFGTNSNSLFKSPLDMLFDELQNGYRIVPAALSSECDEIFTYYKQGLLTNEQMDEFGKFPSQEAYVAAKKVAECNKALVAKAFEQTVQAVFDACDKTEDTAENSKSMIELIRQRISSMSPLFEEDAKDEVPESRAEMPDVCECRHGLKQKTSYVRNSDQYAPGYMQKEDGSYGIAPEDDLALHAYHIFKTFPLRTMRTAAAIFATKVAY